MMNFQYLVKHLLLIFSLFILLQSCVSKKQMLYVQDIESYNNTEVTFTDHTIQVDDILKISVDALIPEAALPYNNVKSGSVVSNNIDVMKLDGYLVSQNMTINFPVLGELSVKEKTTKDLENDIKKLLVDGGFLINPKITIRLLNAKVTILGEVNMPGTFSFTENNISLLQALGLAGDLTIDGNRKDIIIIRVSDGQRTTVNLDLTSASFLASQYQNIQPNDVIIVNPNSKKITSAGLIGNISTFLSIASIILSTIILIK